MRLCLDTKIWKDRLIVLTRIPTHELDLLLIPDPVDRLVFVTIGAGDLLSVATLKPSVWNKFVLPIPRGSMARPWMSDRLVEEEK
jgi:hypothetical protein